MSKSLVQSQFGAVASKYATSTVHAKGASLSRMVELVGPAADWLALDIATGAGHTAAAFAPHVARVVASDITAEMRAEAAKLATERGLTNMVTAEADAENLPFADASFDLVTCRIAPHHFGEPARFIGETWRVLAPGGTFCLVDNISPDAVSTPGFAKAELRDAALTYNAFEKIRDPSHARALAMGEWQELLEETGFEVKAMERLPKDMEFQSWAERMECDPTTIARLRSMLTNAAPALAAFLGPREVDGKLWFTLDEALVVAVKPMA